MGIYQKLGVLYYLVYNPEFWQRDRHRPFEVYKLVNGQYQLESGEPYWMPEVGLGIGRCQTIFGNLPQEQLAWFDQNGHRYLSEAEAERQQKERLAARLRALGEDPDQLL